MHKRILQRTALRLFLLPMLLAAQQRPPVLESPCALPARTSRVEIGGAYYKQQFFPLSGLEGDLTQYGRLRFGYSFDGNVELQFDGTLLNMLAIKQRHPAFSSNDTPGSTTTGDIGDFTLWTKVQLMGEYRFPVAGGFRFGMQLPNASNESGLGMDQFDFYALALLEKHIAGIRLTANAGIAIIESPTELTDQHDMLLYGAGISFPVGEETFLSIETTGRDSNSGRGIPRLASIQSGVETTMAGLRWRIFGVSSLLHGDNSRGIECSAQYEFRL
jgi:hypothetical protein